jgi:hypothetical protein
MMTKEQAEVYFPTSVHTGKPLPHKLKYLLMAPPKWGKTSFFAGVPNALLLAFEEGHADVSCFKVVINAWNVPLKERGVSTDDETDIKYTSAIEIVEALEAWCPYDFIIIDTLDAASKMCTDYETDKAGLRHASDGGDYGKGYDLYQTNPFRRYFNRIAKLGVGVAGTTHVREEWKKNKYGVEEFRRETSLPSGIQRFIHAQADVIINGEFRRRRKGRRERDREVSFDGTNEVMAGTRIKSVYLPVKYIPASPTLEEPDAPWLQWTEFFKNSPAGGKAAEEEYNQLFHGKDDENIPEEAEQKNKEFHKELETRIDAAIKTDLTRVKTKTNIPPRVK